MTFKHINFDDSPVMRSLLKTAYNKGLIKEDETPIVKNAINHNDLSPSENFSENIIKLCLGLRQKGFDKYADQLEEKFLQFKKAESLYDNGEDSEDIVYDAHEEGDVEVAPAEDDHGVVETTIEQHKQIVELVEKTPSGKFSEANKKILNQVLVAFGENDTLKVFKYASDKITEVIWAVGQNANNTQNREAGVNPTEGEIQGFTNLFLKFQQDKIDNFIGYRDQIIFSLSKFGTESFKPEDKEFVVSNINVIITEILGRLYSTLLNKYFSNDRKSYYSIYDYPKPEIKALGNKWFRMLKIAEKDLEKVKENLTGQKGSVVIQSNFIESQSLAASFENTYSKISKISNLPAEINKVKFDFLSDCESLINYFKKWYLSNESIQAGESKDGQINPEKIPQIIKNLGFKAIRNNSDELGVSIDSVKSVDSLNNLMSVWIKYFTEENEV